MQKYGIEHFHVSLVEETDQPEEREKYWIEHYSSFKFGYNATTGGDGCPYLDYDLIVSTYKELGIKSHVAKALGIDEKTVQKVLNERKVDTSKNRESIRQFQQSTYGKIVNQYSLSGEYLKSFPSISEAAKSLNRGSSNGVASHISDVCKGKRKTAYGFIWKWG